MMLRRHMLMPSQNIIVGNFIYHYANVPSTSVDTGLKLVDTDKSYTILTEMSFPGSTVSGNNYKVAKSTTVYGVGTLTNAANPCFLICYQNYIRIRFFDKNTYQYANTSTAPFFSPDGVHRFAHWHETNTNTASINLDGYTTKTTPAGTYTASNDTLLIQASSGVVVHHIFIYNYVLTQQEIDNYISNGIIP